MMLLRNSLRKIKKSLGRYLSLLIIIFIGVLFYSGIIESVPNIKDVQAKYYQESNLMDIKLLSDLGFLDEDVLAIEKLENVDLAVGSYSKDVLVEDDVVRIHALLDEINKPYLIDGRIPSKKNECLADANFYKVGDKIKINEKYTDDLENSVYEVVGTIYSPIYTSDDYGNSSIGNGKLHSYIYVLKDNFKSRYYTEVFIVALKNKESKPYSNSYNNSVLKATSQLNNLKAERLDLRKKEMVMASGGMISYEMLDDCNWYVLNRDDVVSSYRILESQYNQVTTIANVIPIFFIVIVVLMTSNTMNRMIIEERGEMGALLSLGYSNKQIVWTYLMYVLSATLLGSVLGYFIGTLTLPRLVYNCFLINFPDITYKFRLPLFLGCVLVSCLVMIIVTIYATLRELKQCPANLLRPIAPKMGKTIFIERFRNIWNRLSFSSKVTLRNISRYKKRVIMTLLGTAGCTFLIMIGLALRDSINTIGSKQYNDLFKYDNLIILNDSVSLTDDLDNEVFTDLIDDVLYLKQESFKAVLDDNSLDIYLVVPDDEYLFEKYYALPDVNNKERLNLSSDGAIITPKLQKRFDVSVGDYLVIEKSDKKQYKLKVSGVTENYVANYVYMSKELYNKTFNDDLTYNALVSSNLMSEEEIAVKLLDSGKVLSVNFSSDLIQTANNMINGLNEIVVLLVIISSILAFTVLYNLTNINISERTREIATLKVLGFRDLESNAYIYRETLITVIVGIIIGLLITPPIHSLIMDLLEVDTIVFLRQIKLKSYVFSFALTLLFAIIMQWITYFKIKKINMTESLKSVE